MAKIPIALLIDDSCPLVHVYRHHWVDVHNKPATTNDGRPLLDIIPNDFLDRFCDVVERHGMAGKFSIVPAPARKGDIVRGIEGYDPQITRDWLNTARTRLSARFDFTPEGITHNLAIDLKTGEDIPQGEAIWSQTQNRETLMPYLVHELELLKQANFDAKGVTSCWVFGQRVEAEYIVSIVAAQKQVFNRDFSWYYLHIWDDYPETRPYVAYARGKSTLVAINSSIDDYFWDTIDNPRTDRAYIESIADKMLTADGKEGAIRRSLDAGGWPIFMNHWQSFFSNGLETGLAVLDLLGERINRTLADEVEWCTCSEVARRTARECGIVADSA